MNENVSSQIARDTLAEAGEVHELSLQQRSEVMQLRSEASNAIVQCPLIAARRGRQIRLAHEQAAQRQQSESRLACEEIPRPDET